MAVTLEAIRLLFCWFANHVLGNQLLRLILVRNCSNVPKRVLLVDPEILAKYYRSVLNAGLCLCRSSDTFTQSIGLLCRVECMCWLVMSGLSQSLWRECQLSKRSCVCHRGTVTRYSVQYLKLPRVMQNSRCQCFLPLTWVLSWSVKTPESILTCFCNSESFLHARQETSREIDCLSCHRGRLSHWPVHPRVSHNEPSETCIWALCDWLASKSFFFFLSF